MAHQGFGQYGEKDKNPHWLLILLVLIGLFCLGTWLGQHYEGGPPQPDVWYER